MGYSVDRASLEFHTPPGVTVPPLVQDFYDWAEEREGGSIGYFNVEGDRLDDRYIEDGTRSASAFVSFVHMPDGSRVGWWRPAGESLDAAPIVLLGSEGTLGVLGRSPAEFFTKLACAATSQSDLDETVEPNERAALRSWLSDRGAWIETDPDAHREATSKLEAWFPHRSDERIAMAKQQPERIAVSAILRAVIGLPAAAEPWKRTFADLVLTDTQCVLFPNFVGQNPLNKPRGLEEALRALRDRDAQDLPEAGLWYRASLHLDGDGVLMLARSYLDEPRDGIVLDDEGLRRDHARMPRSRYWLPAWLARRLGA